MTIEQFEQLTIERDQKLKKWNECSESDQKFHDIISDFQEVNERFWQAVSVNFMEQNNA